MNEEALNKLLRRSIQKGDVPLELDDALVDYWLNHATPEVSDAVQSNIKRLLKLRLQNVALQQSAESLNETVTPLGRLIATVRSRAGLSRADVAERLGKSDEYLERMEESEEAFPDTTAEEFANLMRILHLTFSKVSETVRRTLDALGFAGTSGWPDAITSGLQNDVNEDRSIAASRGGFRKSGQRHLDLETKRAAEVWLSTLQTEWGKRNPVARLK
jgi:transcriptional regulator with XRE-family HTH domain